MNYFDSNMSNSTNRIVHFEKTVIYVYDVGKVIHNLCDVVQS